MSRMTRNSGAVAAATRTLPLALTIALTLGLTIGPAGDLCAEMYRWVDPDGVTVYSQHPPPDAPATPIRPDAAPSPTETQRAVDRVNAINTEDFDRREDAARQAEETAKEQEVVAARRANCEIARKNLETIDTLGARRVRMPDGEYRFLSESEREEHRAQAQARIKESCD